MKELRVYGIDANQFEGDIFALTNKKFIKIAEEHGFVYSLREFAVQYNTEEVPYDLFIRFIAVPGDENYLNEEWINSEQTYLEIFE
jgi:hypothetical protein